MRTVSDDIGSIVTEIGEHITDIEQARLDDDLPQSMMFSYSTTLRILISKGEALLSKKNNTLVTILSKLSQTDLQQHLMAKFFSCKENINKAKFDRHLLPAFSGPGASLATSC